ncbi:MAG: HNH endonuclease signature motif containing protein [Bryobacteraceae bacterium]
MASGIGEYLRAEVGRRAARRCEYCLIHEDDGGFPHQVDHVVSRKHGSASQLDNLAYACVLCNRRKGSDIASIDPTTGEAVRLFHPRRDRWRDHFRIDGDRIVPLTGVANVTVQLLRLNGTERLAERQMLQGLRRYPTQ